MKKWIAGALVCALMMMGAGALAQQMQPLEFEDGSYFGFLTDGQPEGFGMYTYKDGRLYYGMFKEGVFSGYGCCFFPEGQANSYRLMGGLFSNGRLNGEGVILFDDGSRLGGRFDNGVVVPDEAQKSKDEYILYVGSLTDKDTGRKAEYTGEMLAANPGMPHGVGVFSLSATDGWGNHPSMYVGTSVEGICEDGVFVDIFLDTYWVTIITDGQAGETIDMGR
ncbi:MAG: hypothetical protein LBM74_04220 [Oscillospiraceae bacterium]|jgi:hypothetical protein|nr:hypothetical protein [Oscillospiraceae bacterium]